MTWSKLWGDDISDEKFEDCIGVTVDDSDDLDSGHPDVSVAIRDKVLDRVTRSRFFSVIEQF